MDFFHGNGHKLCIWYVFKSQQIQNLQQHYEKKTWKYSHSSQRNYLKDWYFTKDDGDKYSRSEFYHPEDLEMSNVETETGIRESQEAIDDFIKKQKSADTSKMATDLNTYLH